MALAARLAAADAERLCGCLERAAEHEQAVLKQSGVSGGLGGDGDLRVEEAMLATRFLRTGDAQAAHAAATQLLERRELLHGPGHPLTAGARLGTALTALRSGRADEAFERATDSAEALSAAVGERHQATLAARTVAATALVAVGRPAEAAAAAATVLTTAVTTLGEEHPTALSCAAPSPPP
ncbi:hypothetical protein ACFQ0T_02005 [Kitasatospora gansuensis]